jgi:MFS family permease
VESSPSKIWSRDFLLLFLSALLSWASFYFLLPTLPVYISQRLGGSPAEVGMIFNGLTVTAIMARLLTGFAVERWGRRSVYWISLLAFTAVAFSYHLASSLLVMAAIRLLHGVPFGSASTTNNTVAADLAPPERRGEAMGSFAMASTLAMAIGPALALAIVGEGQFSLLFTVCGVLGLAALALAVAVRYPQVRNAQARFSLAGLFERRVGWLAAATTLAMFGYGGIVTFITVYALQYGIPRPGMFFTVLALGLVVSRVMGGRIFDRTGPRAPILAGLGTMVVALLLLGARPGPSSYLAAAALFGLGQGAITSSALAMGVNSVPAERRGAANATVMSAMDLGIGGGASILGMVAQAQGSYAAMFLVAAGVLVVPVALFLVKVLPGYAGVGRTAGS